MAQKIARLAVLTALALALSAIERLIPVPVAVPGVKLGLANLVTVLALYLLGAREALTISALRVVLAGFLFGSFSSLLYALSGALLSFGAMALLKKTGAFSVIGVSVAGGVFHNVAQITIAALIVKTLELSYYLPVLMLSGIITGLFIGIVANLLIGRLRTVPGLADKKE